VLEFGCVGLVNSVLLSRGLVLKGELGFFLSDLHERIEVLDFHRNVQQFVGSAVLEHGPASFVGFAQSFFEGHVVYVQPLSLLEEGSLFPDLHARVDVRAGLVTGLLAVGRVV